MLFSCDLRPDRVIGQCQLCHHRLHATSVLPIRRVHPTVVSPEASQYPFIKQQLQNPIHGFLLTRLTKSASQRCLLLSARSRLEERLLDNRYQYPLLLTESRSFDSRNGANSIKSLNATAANPRRATLLIGNSMNNTDFTVFNPNGTAARSGDIQFLDKTIS